MTEAQADQMISLLKEISQRIQVQTDKIGQS